MQLEGDDARAASNQRLGERSGTGSNVQDEFARTYAGVVNESFSPPTTESVPTPSCP
jgi:hypothetical protein